MKAWRLLLLTAALVLPATISAPKAVEACPWGDCPYVCRYFWPDYYCYYDDCCNPSCCAWNDLNCINPCSP
jgi:hypothetical protein